MKTAQNLIGKNIVVYDLEIKNVIDGQKITWTDFEKMGISVGCAFDYRENKFRVFLDDNINELVERLNEPDTLIVAFNNISFDNNLLRKTASVKLNPESDLRNYDMLIESKKAVNAGKFDKGFKLDDHLQTMNLKMKTANGAMAPIWFQQGKIGTLIDYCLTDVTVERALFEHIYVNGTMASLNNPKPYAVAEPVFK
jgi:hypothetical protein